MTDHLVTVCCPLSHLYTIAQALDLAQLKANLRVHNIQVMSTGYEKDPKAFPFPFAVDTVDCIPAYQQDEATYKHAYNLAWQLFINGVHVGEPLTDAEAPQTQETALSALVEF